MKIWIRMLEGVETLVEVDADSLSEDLYVIKTNKYLDMGNDFTSIWEFFPGDTVKCKLEEGNLVAKELVSSTMRNRRIYQLIFLIVLNAGKLTKSQLDEHKKEVQEICEHKGTYKNHPVIQTWLKNNCGNVESS